VVRAPAVVVNDQSELIALHKNGLLEKDFIAVVRFQGPQANGMPELHKLTPLLGVLQDKGFHVALVTDGRMSGASGKVPAAIHLSPEALAGGAIGKICDGDMLVLNCETGDLHTDVSDAEMAERNAAMQPHHPRQAASGQGLFALMRHNASTAESGACTLFKD
jgi:phosphogluconate dehydratase